MIGSHIEPEEKIFRAIVCSIPGYWGGAEPLAILGSRCRTLVATPRQVGDGGARLAKIRRVELGGERDRAVDAASGIPERANAAMRLRCDDELDRLAADLARERHELARTDRIGPRDVIGLVVVARRRQHGGGGRGAVFAVT